MKYLCLAVASILIASCSGAPIIEPPEIDQFPNRQYKIHVQGTPEMVRRDITEEFDFMSIPYNSEQNGEVRYLVSTYAGDRNDPGLLENARSAVLVSFVPDRVYPNCTELSLRWMYESKGIFGSDWTLEGNEREHMPYVLKLVKELSNEKRCS